MLCSATQIASAAPASAGSSRQSSARECTKRRRAEIAIYNSQLKFFSKVCTCVAVSGAQLSEVGFQPDAALRHSLLQAARLT